MVGSGPSVFLHVVYAEGFSHIRSQGGSIATPGPNKCAITINPCPPFNGTHLPSPLFVNTKEPDNRYIRQSCLVGSEPGHAQRRKERGEMKLKRNTQELAGRRDQWRGRLFVALVVLATGGACNTSASK